MAASDGDRRAVRVARQALGMTQMDLARRMKISHSKVSLFENGLADLDPDEMRRLQKTIKSGMAKVTSDYKKHSKYVYESAARKDGVPERKALRQRADLSQSELARNAGISQSRISLWETGRAELTKKELASWEETIRSDMECAAVEDMIVERALLKAEKKDIQQGVASLIPALQNVHQEYKAEIERLKKQLTNEREAYEFEIKRLKKERAQLRYTARTQEIRAESNGRENEPSIEASRKSKEK